METGREFPRSSALPSSLLSSSCLDLPLASDAPCRQQELRPLQSLQLLIPTHRWQESFPGHCQAKPTPPFCCHLKAPCFLVGHELPIPFSASGNSSSLCALTVVHTVVHTLNALQCGQALSCVLHFLLRVSINSLYEAVSHYTLLVSS